MLSMHQDGGAEIFYAIVRLRMKLRFAFSWKHAFVFLGFLKTWCGTAMHSMMAIAISIFQNHYADELKRKLPDEDCLFFENCILGAALVDSAL